MLNQFSRMQLIFGKDALDTLQKKRVAVFGIGGVGQYVVEGLVRSGIGAVDLIDDDRICLTNLNRQLVATRKTVGKYKTEMMKERALAINPSVVILEHKCFFLPEESRTRQAEEAAGIEEEQVPDFHEFDYVVDAVDTVTAKISIVMEAKKCQVPVISAMGAGNKINPAMLEVADLYETKVDPLAKVMRREMKKRGVRSLKVVYSKEKPIKPSDDPDISCRTQCICPPGTKRKCSVRRDIPGSTAFVPPVAGLIIASEIVKDLTGIRNDGRVV